MALNIVIFKRMDIKLPEGLMSYEKSISAPEEIRIRQRVSCPLITAFVRAVRPSASTQSTYEMKMNSFCMFGATITIYQYMSKNTQYLKSSFQFALTIS